MQKFDSYHGHDPHTFHYQTQASSLIRCAARDQLVLQLNERVRLLKSLYQYIHAWKFAKNGGAECFDQKESCEKQISQLRGKLLLLDQKRRQVNLPMYSSDLRLILASIDPSISCNSLAGHQMCPPSPLCASFPLANEQEVDSIFRRSAAPRHLDGNLCSAYDHHRHSNLPYANYHQLPESLLSGPLARMPADRARQVIIRHQRQRNLKNFRNRKVTLVSSMIRRCSPVYIKDPSENYHSFSVKDGYSRSAGGLMYRV